MAESGLSFQRFAENITAASPPKAVIKLILVKGSANDPKRRFDLLIGDGVEHRLLKVVVDDLDNVLRTYPIRRTRTPSAIAV